MTPISIRAKLKDMQSPLLRVQAQYDRYPYPRLPWFGRMVPSSLAHACYEAGAALVHGRYIPHAAKKILLLGCGTTEPYAFASTHREAHLTAVDLSSRALGLARLRCRLARLGNIRFEHQDLVKFTNRSKEKYDFVHSFGVLHHLPDVSLGFQAVAQLLADGGFARIMVYSASARNRAKDLRSAARLLGLTSERPESVRLFKKLIQCLPVDHPGRIAFELNTETSHSSGLIDAFLHAQETSFTHAALTEALQKAGLHVQAWDFSEKILEFLREAPGDDFESRMKWLEAHDQFPGHFTFWVAKNPPAEELPPLFVIRNPLVDSGLKGRNVESVLLKQKLTFTPAHRTLLKICEKGAVDRLQIISDDPELEIPLRELIRARFVLEVNG